MAVSASLQSVFFKSLGIIDAESKKNNRCTFISCCKVVISDAVEIPQYS